jgi:hypothetical protein
MKRFGTFGLVALVASVLAGSTNVGCVGERDPINRVQANAIPKSFFVGEKLNDSSDDPEFYARTMVIDVPYGESGAEWGLFTNTINNVARIKWAIEEANLVGRVSFERIDGTDGKGPTPKKERDPSRPLAQNDGVVVYNFKILSQFDIRRSYNPSTGEETNIVEENATDRPWYDREYIRVDFSKNLVTTSYEFDTLSLLGIYGGVKYTPMEFDVRNPLDENAPVYDVRNGYLDVTNKVFAEPQMVNLGGGFTFPGCLLPNFIMGGSEPVGNCNPNEITLRHAFRRVVDTDYEPADWDGLRFASYGAFLHERNGYARDYGVADQSWKRFISRYNIWERSHLYSNPEAMSGPNECLSDADCSGLGGIQGISHCDTFQRKCTLPFQSRKEKPIVWHYADTSSADFFEATRDATEEWDTAMRIAVQTAKYAECTRYGNLNQEGTDCLQSFPGVIDGNFADEEDAIFLVKEVNACRRQAVKDGKADPIAECNGLADQLSDQRKYADGVRAIAKLPAMVVLCHSPVDALDPKICGPRGTIARKGDLRYHLVTTIPTPETGAPWGIYTDASDPLTGEHVAASINLWSFATDLFARGLVDQFRYIGGELKTGDITDGTYVAQWVEAAKASNGVGIAPVLGQEEADKRIASVAGVSVDRMKAAEAKLAARRPMKGKLLPSQRLPIESALLADLKRVAQTKASWDAPSTWAPIYEARMNQLRGTPLEAQLMTPAMQELGKSALGDFATARGMTTGSGDPLLRASSILQGLNPELRKGLYQKLQNTIGERGGCMAQYEALAPLAYSGMAEELQNKFGKFNPSDDPRVQNERADRMKNYLRRRAHSAIIAHEMGHSVGMRHNFVGSSDAWNFRPQYWALRTNGKTVTTECAGDGTGDGARCIGPRWLDKVTPNEQRNLISMWAHGTTMDYPGEPAQDLLGLGVYDFAAARMFYGDAAAVYKDQRFTISRPAGETALQHQNDFGGLLGFRYGDFADPIHYSHLDKEVGLIEKCQTVEPGLFRPASWDDAKDGTWSALLDGHIVTNEAGRPTKCTQPKVDFVQWTALRAGQQDAKSRVRVPHNFASDNWADVGNIAVYRHDNGADLYETMHFWQAQQEMTHIFQNYRRGRRDFSIWAAFQRTLTRYHEKMRDGAKALGLYANLARDTVVQYNSDGNDPEAFVATILKGVATDNAIASSIAFDQFAHVFARPQPGPHGVVGAEEPVNGTTIARSWDSTAFADRGQVPLLRVANGVTGGYGTISLGGRPLENALARDKGRDYDQQYTINVGSYYEKAYTAYLMAESADNFISSSRDDYVDPRFRAVSLVDVFPEGFRRWLANNLTGDDQIKGNYALAASGTQGALQQDREGFVTLGTTQWWPKNGIEVCFPKGDRLFCNDPFTAGAPTPAGGTVVDPQVGFEQQKFAMIFTLLYLPENARTNWLDQLRVYDVSSANDPDFENRIEVHLPGGKTYAAQTFGTEVLFGKTVQKGIAARMIEYANSLLAQAVVTEPVVRGTRTVGLKPKLSAEGNVQYLSAGAPATSCAASAACQRLLDYAALPKLMHELETQLGFFRFGGWLKGVY